MPKPNCTEGADVGVIDFGGLDRRVVEGRFGGGSMTSDGGVMLPSAVDRKLGLIEAASRCIADPRNPLRIIQARWATDRSDARASHGQKRPSACTPARRLAQVLRERRAEESRTGRFLDAGPPPRGTWRTGRNPAGRRGTRKQKRPTDSGWALNDGGQGRNRTTDTRIFNVGCCRSCRFLEVPN